jgi:NAD(P)-dependent dehydrogenase (short-subunit alcohol dehydrogenase family)
MEGRMDGKRALVIGAGQLESELMGNGRAIATRFAREGAEVCLVDYIESRVEATAAEVRQEGGTAHVIVADVSSAEDCARLVREARAAMGRIDAMVNVVGINHNDGTVLTLVEDNWQHIMDTNLRAQWLTCKAVIPIMQDQGGGVITNISTLASKIGSGRLLAYGISKAGVNALTQSIAVSYAPWNIRCNAVLPSFVVTPHSLDGLLEAGYVADEAAYYRMGRKGVPLGRMGDAHDIENAVLFLSSDEANFITGVDLPVDGGGLAVRAQYQRPADAPPLADLG